MKRCPKCGGKKFLVCSHVVQMWVVDAEGEFLDVEDDCVCVSHFPTDDDIWQCESCHYSDGGDQFNVRI